MVLESPRYQNHTETSRDQKTMDHLDINVKILKENTSKSNLVTYKNNCVP